MKHFTENLVDENGIELLVAYEADVTPAYEEEPGLLVAGMVYTELRSVEVVIAGRGIDLLPMLHPNEKEFIISKLTYED